MLQHHLVHHLAPGEEAVHDLRQPREVFHADRVQQSGHEVASLILRLRLSLKPLNAMMSYTS